MRQLKSITQVQQFLESYSAAYNLLNLHRHSLSGWLLKGWRGRSVVQTFAVNQVLGSLQGNPP